jgi:hypothetical protein
MTRRTRNNPSPSGLKALSYVPKKRTQKKTKEEEEDYEQPAPTSTSTTTAPEKKVTQTKKRSRASSKPADAPPAKKRSTRSRHAKTIEVEVPDEEDHDADDDGDADTAMTNYNTPHPSSSSHTKEKPLVGKQQETEYSSSGEQSEGQTLGKSLPAEHSSEERDLQEQEHADEYESQDIAEEDESQDIAEEDELQETIEDTDSQQHAEGYDSRDSAEVDEVQGPVSGEYPSEEVHPKQNLRPSNSPKQITAHLPSPTPKPSPKSSPPKAMTISRPYVHKPHFLTPKPTKPRQKVLDSISPTPNAPNSEPASAVRGGEDRLETVSPLARAAVQTITRSTTMENQEDEEEDANRSIPLLDSPVLTAAQKDQWKEQQRVFRGEAPRSVVSRCSTNS